MQDDEIRRAIGSRLGQCMESVGITDRDLAAAVHRKACSVGRWREGKSMPTSEEWYVIGKLLGVSLDFLVYGIRTVPVSQFAIMETIFAPQGVQPHGAAFDTPAGQ